MLKFIKDFVQRKIVRDQRARWNYQYAKGQWEGLKNSPELVRQEIIKSFFLKHKGKGSLIEFGCGYGVLPHTIFERQHYSHYRGVDVSDFIIQHIQNLSDERHVFEVGDMEKYHFTEKYDVIVFNEVINYAADIPKMIAHYKEHGLKKDGIFIISVHTFKRSDAIWKDIHSVLSALESDFIDNKSNSWKIEVLK